MTDYERYGNYEGSEGTDRGGIGTGLALLFIGLGAGAAIGLLFAPRTGRQMRRNIRRKYEDARDAVEGLTAQASQMVDKGTEWAQFAREKVEPIGRVMRGSR